jgi:hypothetical protein
MPGSIKDLRDRHEKKGTRPSFEEISRTLQSVHTYVPAVGVCGSQSWTPGGNQKGKSPRPWTGCMWLPACLDVANSSRFLLAQLCLDSLIARYYRLRLSARPSKPMTKCIRRPWKELSAKLRTSGSLLSKFCHCRRREQYRPFGTLHDTRILVLRSNAERLVSKCGNGYHDNLRYLRSIFRSPHSKADFVQRIRSLRGDCSRISFTTTLRVTGDTMLAKL